MASKRPFSDIESEQPGRQQVSSEFRLNKGPKKFRPNPMSPGGGNAGSGQKWRNKRMRDIRRELGRHDEMPATARNGLEQELQALQAQRGEKKVKRRRADMISRYHMVRFFERQKATRRLKKFQKALDAAEDPEEKARLEREVHMTEVDIAYTQYFPHLEPYVSIWPNNKDKKGGHDGKQDEPTAASQSEDPNRRPEMWHAVEEAMKEGPAALERIRDRRDVVDFHSEPLPFHGAGPKNVQPQPPSRRDAAEKKKDKGSKSRLQDKTGHKREVQRSGHWQEANDDDDDDGEGFFE